jgi:hypothetical protein
MKWTNGSSIAVASLAIAAGLVYVLLAQRTPAEKAGATVGLAAVVTPTTPGVTPPIPVATSTSPVTEPLHPASANGEPDALKKAEELLPRAEAGDKDAQAELYLTLGECDEGYRLYFVRGDKTRTVDEALMWASTRPTIRAESIQRIYDKCHRLMEQRPARLKTAEEWLARATAAGQPVAAAHTANNILAQVALAGFGENKNLDTERMRAEATRDLRLAASSGLPDALWKTADVLGYLTSDREKAKLDRLAFKLVACSRGYDCSETANWYQQTCTEGFESLCEQRDGGVEFLKRAAGDALPEVEARVKEIDAALKAGKGADLIAAPRMAMAQ